MIGAGAKGPARKGTRARRRTRHPNGRWSECSNRCRGLQRCSGRCGVRRRQRCQPGRSHHVVAEAGPRAGRRSDAEGQRNNECHHAGDKDDQHTHRRQKRCATYVFVLLQQTEVGVHAGGEVLVLVGARIRVGAQLRCRSRPSRRQRRCRPTRRRRAQPREPPQRRPDTPARARADSPSRCPGPAHRPARRSTRRTSGAFADASAAPRASAVSGCFRHAQRQRRRYFQRRLDQRDVDSGAHHQHAVGLVRRGPRRRNQLDQRGNRLVVVLWQVLRGARR